MTETLFTWPPPYTIKEHPRARHVKLKTSVKHGLEIVVPKRFNKKHLPTILNENKTWIEKQFKKIADKQFLIGTQTLPEFIDFHAIGQRWAVHYLPCLGKLRITFGKENEVIVRGDTQNHPACHIALTHWAKKMAREHLIEQLRSVSEKTQLSYSRATIRGQQSRWGSCSADKVINLNYKLLFLPPHLAEHILIHELCHTVHLNHSTRFWKLLSRFDPDWKAHNRLIKSADHFVPAWAI